VQTLEELIAADGPAPIGCIAFLCTSCKAERSETLRVALGMKKISVDQLTKAVGACRELFK